MEYKLLLLFIDKIITFLGLQLNLVIVFGMVTIDEVGVDGEVNLMTNSIIWLTEDGTAASV